MVGGRELPSFPNFNFVTISPKKDILPSPFEGVAFYCSYLPCCYNYYPTTTYQGKFYFKKKWELQSFTLYKNNYIYLQVANKGKSKRKKSQCPLDFRLKMFFFCIPITKVHNLLTKFTPSPRIQQEITKELSSFPPINYMQGHFIFSYKTRSSFKSPPQVLR
jgi:hypothetical protein